MASSPMHGFPEGKHAAAVNKHVHNIPGHAHKGIPAMDAEDKRDGGADESSEKS